MKTEYTATLKKQYGVRFVCSECGHLNAQVHTIAESVKTTSGVIISNAREQALKNEISETALDNMQDRIEKIIEESKEKKYYSAKYRMKCSKCGHKEPWAKLYYGFFKSISYLLLIVAIIAGMLILSDGSNNEILIFAVTALALIAISLLIKLIRRKYLDNRIKNLPEESLPQIIVIKNL